MRPQGFANVGEPTDLYAPAATFETLTLGEVHFTAAGDKYFRFTVTGKNPESRGYVLALDLLSLVPVGAASSETLSSTGQRVDFTV